MRIATANLAGERDSANASNGIYDALLATAKGYGFDYCCHIAKNVDEQGNADLRRRDNYPKRWRQHYLSKNYAAVDPIIQVVMQADEPTLWTPDLFNAATEMQWDATRHGLRYGWSVPVQNSPYHDGVVSFVRRRTPITAKEAEKLARVLTPLAEIAHLGLIGTWERDFMEQTPAHLPQVALTKRELDVLRLTAEGIARPEIATMLEISIHTVTNYAEEAREKLGGHNITNAVVIAMRMGLLE